MKSVKTAVSHDIGKISEDEAKSNLYDIKYRMDYIQEYLQKIEDFYNQSNSLSKRQALTIDYGITNVAYTLEETLSLLKIGM